MLKKLIACTILASMLMHCGFRLGLLDQLYQLRYDIAFAVGLIDEKPIAMCSSDYSFDDRLKIESHDTFPSIPQLVQAKEINLFFISEYQQLDIHFEIRDVKLLTCPVNLYELTLQKSVFHPPCTLS